MGAAVVLRAVSAGVHAYVAALAALAAAHYASTAGAKRPKKPSKGLSVFMAVNMALLALFMAGTAVAVLFFPRALSAGAAMLA